ncbi:hypothetical protein [Streptodolium elevatio]
MVTSNHEATHRIIQEHPEVLSAIFELLCLPLPADASFTVVTPDVTEMRPVERRIDTVLRIDPPERESFLLAVESQGKKDLDKPSCWAYYVGFLAAKSKLPVMLLVVSQNRATSRWARGPFGFGPEGCHTLTLHPTTAGPDNIPRITNPADASANIEWRRSPPPSTLTTRPHRTHWTRCQAHSSPSPRSGRSTTRHRSERHGSCVRPWALSRLGPGSSVRFSGRGGPGSF